jgi:hypothetical protein
VLIGLDSVYANFADVFQSSPSAHRIRNIAGAGFKSDGRSVVLGMLKGDLLKHIAVRLLWL